jgi:hypothetical protein
MLTNTCQCLPMLANVCQCLPMLAQCHVIPRSINSLDSSVGNSVCFHSKGRADFSWIHQSRRFINIYYRMKMTVHFPVVSDQISRYLFRSYCLVVNLSLMVHVAISSRIYFGMNLLGLSFCHDVIGQAHLLTSNPVHNRVMVTKSLLEMMSSNFAPIF